MRSKTRIQKRAAGAIALAAIVVATATVLIGAAESVASTPAYAPAYHAATQPDPLCNSVDTTRNGRWAPHPTTAAWQWQLQGKIDTSVPACVFDVDGFETPKSTVEELHQKGVKVICYLDVGSWEEYRPDASQFPKSVLGRRYEGFPNERWLDIRHFHKFAPIMEKRISMCAEKGFDAVEPDNITGWENKTGFPITAADQTRYNGWIARQVHKRGMSVALKNDPGQAKQQVGLFDFAIVEECFQYNECSSFKPFIEAGKAVFETEYKLPTSKFCGRANALDFSSIRKSLDLFAKPWEPCGEKPSS